MQNQTEMSPPLALEQMLLSSLVSQGIYVAAKLGIADLLNEGCQSSDKLASLTGVDARSLYRVLRVLASVGIFAEGEDGRFQLTPLAACLQTGVPNSLRSLSIFVGEAWHQQPFSNLLYSVKTGKTAFGHTHGMELFQYLTKNPEAADIFNAAMTELTVTLPSLIATDYDFSSTRKIVDIGGGQGSLITSILIANPNMQGILFDLPLVIAGAQPTIEAAGLTERCQLMAGNFLESVPSGGDTYIMKHIIHDWDDQQAIAILKNCHSAMTANSKLLLVEKVIPPGNQPLPIKLQDLEMLVITGGCERTATEYQALLQSAGFELTNIMTTKSSMNLIESVRI